MGMPDLVQDLLGFVDRSPTPYHAVAESAVRLEAAGFSRISEGELWDHGPGACCYVVRNDGSLAAFQVGSMSPAEGGFRILGAHTDSPNLRLKPEPDVSAHGYRQLAVEPYGGVLLHTWLDRDLSLAGRVSLAQDEQVRADLNAIARPKLRVPNLAIHLFREIKEQGLKINPQHHAVPVIGLDDTPPIRELLATELRAQGLSVGRADQVLSFDLMLYDTQPSGVIGSRGEFISAPRLDNLASTHAILTALQRSCAGGPAPFTRVAVFCDHEEEGSRRASGAEGTFLADVLLRVVSGYKGGEPQGLSRALASSQMVSVDMAHAIHPNYADKQAAGHAPVVGRGPVNKVLSLIHI